MAKIKKYVFLAACFLFCAACRSRILYSIRRGAYTYINVDDISLKYYGDYQFFAVNHHDLLTVDTMINKLTLTKLKIRKKQVLFVARTNVSPFIKQFLIRMDKASAWLGPDSLVNRAVPGNRVYYYRLAGARYGYMFIHYQLRPTGRRPLDSTMAKNEFLFTMRSNTRL